MEGRIYKDYIYDGSKDNNGIVVLEGIDAVLNALRMWLMSYQNDVIRWPSFGGRLVKWIYRPLTEQNAFDLKNAILIGLEKEFTPHITVTSIKVIPDILNSQWIIDMSGHVDILNEELHIITNLRKQR